MDTLGSVKSSLKNTSLQYVRKTNSHKIAKSIMGCANYLNNFNGTMIFCNCHMKNKKSIRKRNY